jgi:cation diffusion facilitator family transporter
MQNAGGHRGGAVPSRIFPARPKLLPYCIMHDTHALDDNVLMRREKNNVALTSVVAAVFLTVGKLIVGLWTGSLGILSEAAHSGLDLLAAAVTFFAVRVADRPPDEDHTFGHGKVENLSALFETLLLLITCVWILYEASRRLLAHEHHIEVNIWSFAVIGVSIVIDIGRSRALYRVARKYDSQALEADALHFSTDIYSSLVVLFGLLSVKIGIPEADALAAILVACIVIWISVRLGKSTIDMLLDRVPEGQLQRVRDIVEKVDGVHSIRSLRIRQAGAKTFIDVRIRILRKASFDEVHHIMETVEKNVGTHIPRSDIIIHSEPVIGDDEHLAESIHWLVREEGLTPHNVTILASDAVNHVDLDIEFPPGTSFEEAHRLAEQVESRVRDALPHVASVCVHLEEQSTDPIAIDDVTTREAELIERITELVRGEPQILACTELRIFASHSGLKISMACSLPRALTLRETHVVVNNLESAITRMDGRIIKVFIHAEPGEGSLIADR